jgi:hypothetical protein
MAKRASRSEGITTGEEQPLGAMASAEQKIEEFAEDLGRLLGTARAKAEGWLGQRQAVATRLEEIRDTAADLLKKLGGGSWASVSRATRTVTARRPGRSRVAVAAGEAAVAAVTAEPKRRTMSAAARKAISDAQKARWARQKRAKKLEKA